MIQVGGVVGAEGADLAELAARLCLAASSSTCVPRLDQLLLARAPGPVPGPAPDLAPAESTADSAAQVSAQAEVYTVEVLPSVDLGAMVPGPEKLAAVLADAASAGRMLEWFPGYSAVRCSLLTPLGVSSVVGMQAQQ